MKKRFLFVVRFKSKENGKMSAPKTYKTVAKSCEEACSRCKKAKGGRIIYARKVKPVG